MADITVRKMRFHFDVQQDLTVIRNDVKASCDLLGLSLTMPYLEPYLIRTMREATKQVTDPILIEDMKRFSAQESYHYGNHAKFNERIRECVGEDYALKIQAIEDALEADYQRFTKDKSLAFNVAYAEGFEAMTSALAVSICTEEFLESMTPDWRKLFEWHIAEEIEHRTVCFDVFEHLIGSYSYRLTRGVYAQAHYLGYIQRFSKCLMQALGHTSSMFEIPSYMRSTVGRYLKTWSPRYNPANFGTNEVFDALLAKYSDLAEAGGQA